MSKSKTFNFYMYYKQGDDFSHYLGKAREGTTDEKRVVSQAFRLWADHLKSSYEECLKLADACDGQDIEGDGGANCTFLHANGPEAITALEALANDDNSSVSVDECWEEMNDDEDGAEAYAAFMGDPDNYTFWNGKLPLTDSDKINVFVAETEEQAVTVLKMIQESQKVQFQTDPNQGSLLDDTQVCLLTADDKVIDIELVNLVEDMNDVWLIPRTFRKENIIPVLAEILGSDETDEDEADGEDVS